MRNQPSYATHSVATFSFPPPSCDSGNRVTLQTFWSKPHVGVHLQSHLRFSAPSGQVVLKLSFFCVAKVATERPPATTGEDGAGADEGSPEAEREYKYGARGREALWSGATTL